MLRKMLKNPLKDCREWSPSPQNRFGTLPERARAKKVPKIKNGSLLTINLRPRETRGLFLEHIFSIFLRFVRSGVFRKRPGSILEAPGTLPDQISVGFCDISLPVPSGSCRGLSGSAGMSPGSASNLSNPLAGVPLGYGDLAQRFKFAVPQRGAGVVLN